MLLSTKNVQSVDIFLNIVSCSALSVSPEYSVYYYSLFFSQLQLRSQAVVLRFRTYATPLVNKSPLSWFASLCSPLINFFWSRPQVWHVEMLQTKHLREVPYLVESKGLGEDVDHLPICSNIP